MEINKSDFIKVAKISVALICIFITGDLLAQEVNNTCGVGPFEVGKTDTGVIWQIGKEIHKTFQRVKGNYNPGSNKKYFVELVTDSNNMVDEKMAMAVPGVRTFRLSGYNVGGIEFTDASLTFYKNLLIEIDCKFTHAIEQYMNLKYDSASVINKDGVLSCLSKNDTMRDRIYSWGNPFCKIKAVAILKDAYIINCEKMESSMFFISDSRLVNYLNKINQEMEARSEKRRVAKLPPIPPPPVQMK